MQENEKELVERLFQQDLKVEQLKAELKEASKDYDKTESLLIEFLENQNATATARYDGVGYVSLNKPRLYANCKAEDYPDLRLFLEQIDRLDLVKETVMPGTLSSFVSEWMEEGNPMPEFISYYLKPSVRLNKK